VSVNPATLLVLPVILPSSILTTFHDIGSTTAVQFCSENMGTRVAVKKFCRYVP